MSQARGHHRPPVFFHLKLAGKVSLGIAAAAAAGLALVVVALVGHAGNSYRQAIGAYGLARENLAPALLLFGLAMVALAGIATWLITLYASFRFAGPLYRFSRNLELVTEQGPAARPVPLRGSDDLQHECEVFRVSVATLNRHYDELRLLAQQAQLEAGFAAADGEPLHQALARLREAERRVRL